MDSIQVKNTSVDSVTASDIPYSACLTNLPGLTNEELPVTAHLPCIPGETDTLNIYAIKALQPVSLIFRPILPLTSCTPISFLKMAYGIMIRVLLFPVHRLL
jgi:hypothetical protein